MAGTTGRAKFAGGDQAYLRDEQYACGDRLQARADLHRKHSTNPLPWLDWVRDHLALQPGSRVLECGCGTGWLWTDSDRVVPNELSLTLTDLSPGMVAAATQRVVGNGRIGQVVGEVADLQHLSFPAQDFDLVIANHMLYHLPDPRLGVAELARVVRPGGRVVVATNGVRHMRELWQIRAEVFGTPEVDQTLDVFSAEIGFPLLRDHFGSVTWHQYDDELRCTEPADVLAYLCSTPPGEDASESQRAWLDELVDERFRAGRGTFTITKDSGCFTCSEPR